MKYDFDHEVARAGTNSIKWDFCHDDGKEPRMLPMWVADMDFPCPAPVVEALVARASHGIYGYTGRTHAYLDSVVNWMQKRHNWTISPEWICYTPGVVAALNVLVRTFVSPGERVLIQPPVYHPFFSAAESNQSEVLANPLIYENGQYHMDFADLQQKVRDPRVKMAILCNPHNPVGRVWAKDELVRFGELCMENNILVVSDEIHGDLIYRGNTLTPFASAGSGFASRTITCTAPSKTFNMAGLQVSNIIISDPDLRARFQKALMNNGFFGANLFGLAATEAAYTCGEEWLEQVIDYLAGNLRFLEEYISREIPQLSAIHPEGTYLIWLDCRKLGLDRAGLNRLMRETARIVLNDGCDFGPQGEGFQRINIACPRSILIEALERIKDAVHHLPQHPA
ncbi:MAG TPA: MalY/PatB family protein [Anaerolineae bacterium]